MPNDSAPKTVTSVAERPQRAIVVDDGLFSNLMDTSRFEHLQRVSKVFANSSLVPEHFRGKEADCFIAVEMAMRLKLHPFNLMQSLYVVHGKPGIEAKMAIALINSSGIFEGPLQFKLAGEGMKRQCTAFAVHAKTRQVCETTVTMEMAKAEGWIDKSGSKWKTLPDLMLQYRSASFFARLYCPEVIFGMQTREELDEIDVTPAGQEPASPRRTLKDRLGAGTVIDGATGQPDTATAPLATAHQERARDPANDAKSTTSATEPAARRPAPQPGANATTEELIDGGHIVIHDDPQAGAGATAGAGGAGTASVGKNAATDPQRGPPMDFEAVLRLAKKAKSQDQADIVLDALNDPGYTDDQRTEVKTILNSKKYTPEG